MNFEIMIIIIKSKEKSSVYHIIINKNIIAICFELTIL